MEENFLLNFVRQLSNGEQTVRTEYILAMEESREIGDWLKVSDLGSGAFGVVSLWRNIATDESVAVKKCRFSLPSNLTRRQRERWTNEVLIMKKIKNDNIVSYKNLPPILEKELAKYNPTKLPLLSMEYCTQGNLRTLLMQVEHLNGLQESEVRFVLQDMENAVSYLHGLNITHRDLKPENIVLQKNCQRPNGLIYKLIDLGYAKELETLGASLVGTLQYLAPEIFEAKAYTSNVDYWSLGIVAFEIITGTHPFLPHLPPIQRFQYIKDKPPEVICIRTSKKGNIKHFSEIVKENHISQAFRKNIEDWLRLVLQYESQKRGLAGNERKNVFTELKSILNKKIINVFSVYNYKLYSYEINDSTTMEEIREQLENDTGILKDDQLIITSQRDWKFDNEMKLMDCCFEIKQEITLYIFKMGDLIQDKIIILPELIKTLFESGQKGTNREVLRQLYAHSIYFITHEDKLLQAFKSACIFQIEHLEFLCTKEKELFIIVRNSLLKLMTEIECHCKINQKVIEKMDQRNEKFLHYLTLHRKYLRQSKELVENVNSLTERHLLFKGKESILKKHAEDVKVVLKEADLKNLYNDAIKLYQQQTQVKFSCRDMSKVVSDVLKLRFKTFGSDKLTKYINLSWKLLRKLRKIFKWMEALHKEINEISEQNCANECGKYLISNSTSADTSYCSISLPVNLDRSLIETNSIIKENMELRYSIQDKWNEMTACLRDMVKLDAEYKPKLNGVI